MSIARFSPFELLLLKSRNQMDTAALLLLAWVLVNRAHISEGQRRRRLAQVTASFRHGHELGPVLQIAHAQDLQAIQLAAEVLRKECSPQRGLSVMHQAITLATDNGELSQPNHYILRFLADLLSIAPGTFQTLFQELAGAPMSTPDDLSREAYWQTRPQPSRRSEKPADESPGQERQARKEEARREKAEKKQRAQQEKAQKEQQEKEQQEQARKERQERERRERARYERERQEQRHRQHESAYTPPPGDRRTRALSILGLPPGASRGEVRQAYRRMAQLHHPDRFFSESEQLAAQASLRFQKIKKAYDYLMEMY
ncbi:J domain-containing protein [Halomonas sp. Bachu 37]|uniref:J domain-containing protein n=1 Tax=Halomonas kashgarensis TaxID=3084920 RepID=UPI0032173B7B